jgi:hypothetical protein
LLGDAGVFAEVAVGCLPAGEQLIAVVQYVVNLDLRHA